jgi:hypothetical protein
VLRVLGWHLPFRWTDKSTVGNATAVPVSLVKLDAVPFVQITCH